MDQGGIRCDHQRPHRRSGKTYWLCLKEQAWVKVSRITSASDVCLPDGQAGQRHSEGKNRSLTYQKPILVIDELGLAPMTESERRDLLEVIEERHGHASTIVTSQLPVEHWHEQIGDPTVADAILDRLVHNAHKINLKGGSLRRKYADLTPTNKL
jgi:hypothetical protein